jgi:DNA invertase Pin-like site-specific DNA recombinase
LTRLGKKDWGTLSALLRSKGILVVYMSLPTTHGYLSIESRKASDQFSIMETFGKCIEEIMAQFAYEDNAQRKIRIVQGLEDAKKRGVVLGRKKGSLSKRIKEKLPAILFMLKEGTPQRKIAAAVGVCLKEVNKINKEYILKTVTIKQKSLTN